MHRQLLALWSLFAGIAILLVGHGLQLSLLPLRAETLGWTSSQVGWTSSLYFAGFLLGCYAVPNLVRAVGHIRVFTVLTAMMTAALLGISLIDKLGAWLVLRCLIGFCASGLYLVVESWLNEEVSNANRGSLLSVYTVIVLLSMAGGQMLLNVDGPDSYKILVIAASCVALAAVPVGLTRLRQPGEVPHAAFSPWLVVRTSRVAAFSSLVAGAATGCFYGLGSYYGKQVDLDVQAIGFMMAGGILGGALFQWPLGRISDSVDRRKVILAAMLGGVAVCSVATMVATSVVPYLFFLFGGFVMPIYSLALAHAADNVEKSFLEIGTGILILNAAGATVGPLFASTAMEIWGVGAFFVFCAAVLALGAAGTLLMILRRPALRPHFSPFEIATTESAQGAIEFDPRS